MFHLKIKFMSKIGIPTGGSLSRQIADIFLHWILFIKASPKITDLQAIKLWKRFIDDCIGIWRGSKRSFDNFVRTLNQETMKFGIRFPLKEIQFGKEVNILDLKTYYRITPSNTEVIRNLQTLNDTSIQRVFTPDSFSTPSHILNYSELFETIQRKRPEILN